MSGHVNISAEHFEQRLLQHFAFEPTYGQKRLFYAFTRMMFSDKPRCALIIKGYAGTGKTTTVSAMVKGIEESGKRVVLLAPTGRAAKVLGNYSGISASTIHKQIYYRKSDRSGHTWFELKENELENTVFFVDEASMIGTERFSLVKDDIGTGDLLEDLVTHVFSGEGCRLVLIGDGAQLPPVGSDQSPALNLNYLRNEFSLNIAELELSEVIRQKEGSGILENATMLRQLINSQSKEYPTLNTEGFSDISRVESDLQPIVEDAISKYGLDGTLVITRSNKNANKYNQQIRARILNYEEEINGGDHMMVIKNNYFWLEKYNIANGFIANGDMLVINRVRGFEERGEFRFCKATVSMLDFPDIPEMEVLLLMNPIWEESSGMSFEKLKELGNIIAEDYQELENIGKIRKAVQEDPYYNALHVKFGYAITCHKSQGGQWPCVIVDQGYVTEEMFGLELNRWIYTAFTRAQKELYLVGFS
ncbi:MAG: AAA family ATPase [Flavobacteriales bacterium]